MGIFDAYSRIKIGRLINDLKGYNTSEKAIKALTAIGNPAVEQLIDSLNLDRDDDDRFLRGGAAEVLGHIRDPRAVEPLAHTISHDKDELTRQKAAEALGKIRDKRASEALLLALKDPDSEVQRLATNALARIGDPVVGPLIQALSNESRWVKGGAADALGQIRDPRAVEPLLYVLSTDTDRWVRAEAAKALGKIGDPRAVEPLIHILPTDAHVGSSVAIALAEIGDKRAVEPLIRILDDTDRIEIATDKDTNRSFWASAAQALGYIGDLRAVDPLIHALQPAHVNSIGLIDVALSDIGDPAVQPLINALESGNKYIRYRAARALGYIGDARASKPLTAALNDENEDVREAAKSALDVIKGIEELVKRSRTVNDKDSVSALIKLIADDYKGSMVQRLAEGALKTRAAEMTGAQALQSLTNVTLTCEHERARNVARIALRKVKAAASQQP